MRVAICYNSLTEDDVISFNEVETQVNAVKKALINLGHEVIIASFGLNLMLMKEYLDNRKPDCIFNLVDALYAHDQLLALPIYVWEMMGIPYAGSSLECLLLSSNKVLAKTLMRDRCFPTPDWMEVAEIWPDKNTRWILKNVWDHGSRDLDDDSVFDGDLIDVQCRLNNRIARTGRKTFAEEFIDGREISVGVISCPDGIEILPPTEIDYSALPRKQPAILNYNSKWVHNTFEYANTPLLALSEDDAILANRLAFLTYMCCDLFQLSGWGRIDFRIDKNGKPWILEINGNACLSPDAGFQTQLALAGIPFDTAIQWILNDAMKRGKNAKPN
jgi:D-alanine-D-alanine ligase